MFGTYPKLSGLSLLKTITLKFFVSMPSIFCRSKLRAVSDHYSLNLNARHRLVAGAPSDTLYPMNKTRFPECVDVRLSSNLVVTLSGTVDGSEIPAAEIIESSLAQHLVDYLQTVNVRRSAGKL